MIKKVNVIIDGKNIQVNENCTILEAARKAKINIPTLCFLKDINEEGNCRMCIVKVEGINGFVASCTQKVTEGMIVYTNTPEIIEARKTILSLILSNHNKNCLTCVRNTNCELQTLAAKYNLTELLYLGDITKTTIDKSSYCIERDTSKCILCKRCVNVCKKVQGIGAISNINRGFNSKIGVAFEKGIKESPCVGCGQCVVNCPTGALREKPYSSDLEKALLDEETKVIIQIAPSVRVTIGEEFGLMPGEIVTEKLVTALKKIGAYKVFDTNIGADITIMEEGTEFLERLNKNIKLPMITSCSSGWIEFAEKFYPEILPNLSTCKSPMQIVGTLIKTYYAEKNNIDPDKIYSVAIMPCSAKKGEIERPGLLVNNLKTVDTVLTTRELARLLKSYGIDLKQLENTKLDNPLGESTGAGAIFGRNGGVMEAAIRTLYGIVNKEKLEKIEYTNKDKEGDIKEAKIKLGDKEINICIVQTLAKAKKILDDINNGKSKYHFIEVMTCKGGCIMGGGQPIHGPLEDKNEILIKRKEGLNKIDMNSKEKTSNENKQVHEIYEKYLGKPNTGLAHRLLHTEYNKKECFEN